MGVLRRTASVFAGSLLAAAILTACGKGAGDDSGRNDAQPSIGIPIFRGVESGEIEAQLSSYGGGAQDPLYMRVLGVFIGADRGMLPQVDFGAEANGEWRGESVNFNTALIVTNDRAVLTFEGDTFETDRQAFETLQASFGRALGNGSPADFAACLEAAGEINPGRVASKLTRPIHGTALDETEVSIVSAQLKIHGLIEALQQIQADPGCETQLRAAGSFEGLLAGVEAELEQAKGVEARLALDENGILRELSVHVALASRKGSASDAEFLIRLSNVNEIRDLPPCYGEQSLAALFEKLGFNPMETIERGESEGLIGLLRGIFGSVGETSRA
jgi:hypothetical protein